MNNDPNMLVPYALDDIRNVVGCYHLNYGNLYYTIYTINLILFYFNLVLCKLEPSRGIIIDKSTKNSQFMFLPTSESLIM